MEPDVLVSCLFVGWDGESAQTLGMPDAVVGHNKTSRFTARSMCSIPTD